MVKVSSASKAVQGTSELILIKAFASQKTENSQVTSPVPLIGL